MADECPRSMGTDNRALLDDPMYLGLRKNRSGLAEVRGGPALLEALTR